MSKVRFSKANVLAHIQNSMDLLIAEHGERIQGGYSGIQIMKPSDRKDRLMRAWGEHDSLRKLYWDIADGDLEETGTPVLSDTCPPEHRPGESNNI